MYIAKHVKLPKSIKNKEILKLAYRKKRLFMTPWCF